MIGTTVSHYRILQTLGQGGMGVVYKALDVLLDRPVALKFVMPQFAGSPQAAERLLREARAASTLNHPNVVTVYEVGEHEGTTFIAIEYVEGKGLHDLIRPGGLEVEFCLRCAVQIASALRSAHALGIVHRDIKPHNIMLTPDNRVKILDFGLARQPAAQDQLTRTGTLAGTTRYMSPEQIQGQPVNQRSDIFSFGIVLYEMLSGRVPFEGEYEVAVLYSILNADPLPLHELVPGVSQELSALVARCLCKAPDDRFQDCGAIIEALNQVEILRTPATGGDRVPSHVPPPLHVLPSREASVSFPVGRSSEIAHLHGVLESTLRGEGRTLFIGGEPGVGKTHLLTAFMEEAKARGCVTLWGRCPSQEAGFPYHPFATAFGSHFQAGGLRELERLSARATRQEINFAGRSATLKAFLKLTPGAASVQNKEQLWDALLLLLRVMASESPLLLVLDDIHWIDSESFGLFCFLARNIRSLPIFLVGLYRREARGSATDDSVLALTAAIRQLKIEQAADDMTLGRLSQDQTSQLMRQALGNREVDMDVVRRVYSTTGGNPLFISELATLMKSTGTIELRNSAWRLAEIAGSAEIPGRVRDVIMQRLGSLSPGEREILEIASCEGDYFGSDTLAICLKIDRVTLLRHLQGLEKEHALIRHEKNSYRFDCPLIRQVLYESILPELREEYHRMIAGSLIPRFGSEITAAARIGHHLFASGQHSAALDYLVRAGDYARSLSASEEAREHYRKASAILKEQGDHPAHLRLRVEEGLGDIASDTGRIGEANRHYEAMLIASRELRDVRKEVTALRKKANTVRMLGRITEALDLCSQALALAQGAGLPDLQTECLNALAFIHAARGEYDRTINFSMQALTIARARTDIRATAVSLSNLGVAEMHTGDYRSAAEHLAEAKSLQEYAGDRKGLSFTLNYLALVDHRLARFETALCHTRASLELKESLADTGAIPGTLNVMGDVHRDSGNVDAALECHSRALALAREQNNRGAQCDNLRDLGSDYLLKGDFPQARACLDEVLSLAQAHGYAWYETRSLITLGELCRKTGTLDDAEGFSQRGFDLAQRLKANELIIEASWQRALVTDAQGKRQEALMLLQSAIALAESSGHQLFLWQMYRDLGRVLDSGSRRDDAAAAREKGRTLVQTIAQQLHDDALRRRFLAIAVDAESYSQAGAGQ